MNRWQLETMRGGVAQELKESTEKLTALYADISSDMEQRQKQARQVEETKERLEGINRQITEMDEAAQKRMKAQQPVESGQDSKLTAKAAFYRAAMRGEVVEDIHRKALKDDEATGGGKFLPKTVSSEIITEPVVKNPLREISTITSISNLEVPKLTFSLDDDVEFIADGEAAKEIEATGSTVAFERHKFKVFVDVSETVLKGSDAQLVSAVDRGLESGLAAKEKRVAFAKAPKAGEEHMSFYQKKVDGTYEIGETACPADTSRYKAIKKAIGLLPEDFRENASVMMRFDDYLDIIEELANGSASLYAAPPEQVIGKPVKFCDKAEIPIVGDFSYSHFNYDTEMIYDRDKNVKTGMEAFVLTAWIDHQIKLKSAFRLATVKASQS